MLLCTLFPLLSMGQSAYSGERPDWTKGYFKEMPNSYVEVVSAFGYDLKEARDKAAKEAIHRRSLATGAEASVRIFGDEVKVDSNHDVIVKHESLTNISTTPQEVILFICWFRPRKTQLINMSQ